MNGFYGLNDLTNSLFNHDSFNVDKLPDAIVGKLTPITALFDATEGQSGV